MPSQESAHRHVNAIRIKNVRYCGGFGQVIPLGYITRAAASRSWGSIKYNIEGKKKQSCNTFK